MRRCAALPLAIALSTLAAGPATAGAQDPPPIIDVHLHALPADAQGPPPLAMCIPQPMPPVTTGSEWAAAFMAAHKDPRCDDPIWSPETAEEIQSRTLAILERRNVIGVTSGPPELVARWKAAAPDRIISGVLLDVGSDPPTPDQLRQMHADGHLQVLGEVVNQYSGIEADDERFEPYLALAEELDIPVGIHIGTGPPGAPYLGSPDYRARMHSPLALEDALLRHPDLRLYVMHAGWPMLDDMMALLYTHPQVHVGIGVIVYTRPRAEFYRYLRTLVEAGFQDRILFGSDQMVWPEALDRAIRVIEEAPFLTDVQKRAILYDNAARFLRLDVGSAAAADAGG
jgi:predicted TIM-barrel fold metal-dependent hydrolase